MVCFLYDVVLQCTMVVQSTLKRVNPTKNKKRHVTNIKIALTTKRMLDSSRKHPRETYDDLIQKLVNSKSPQFSFDGINELAKNEDLQTIVNDVIGGIKVFRATKGNMHLDCVQDPSDSKVNVTLVKSIPHIDYNTFETLKTAHDGNTNLRFSGDLNTVRVLENPSRYGLDHETAFKKLLEQKKEIGLLISYKFNNEENNLQKIKNELNTQISFN